MSAQGSYSSRHEKQEARHTASPQPDGRFSSASHKRTASGNPRPTSRTHEDRRVEERRTERTYVTRLESVVHRTRSPERVERRAAPGGEKGKATDKQRATETRPAEDKAEPPQRMYLAIPHALCRSG